MNPFKLEVYLSKYEFLAPYLLCCSDAQTMSMHNLLTLADPQEKNLWKSLDLGYTEDKGLPVLREQITKILYPTLNAENILCFAGAEDGIFCALSVICKPGSHIITLTPCYQSLAEIPKSRGCIVTEIPLKEENNWCISINDIQKSLKPNTSAIIINFPHNPTGQIITQEELNDLVTLCKNNDLWLFSDEVYRLLGNPNTPWALPAAQLYSKAISVNVMSKAYGMAGLRIGWIACQDEEILTQIKQMKHYTSICNSAPAEILTLIALKNSDHILARNNAIVASNLKLLDTFFAEFKELFSWVRPQGGCTGFARYKGTGNVTDFCETVVERTGVLLLPGFVYNQPNHFRIGFGRSNMPEALKKLHTFLKQ